MKKKALFLLFTLALLLCLCPAFASADDDMPATSGQCGDGLLWQFSGGTLTITGSGAMYDFVDGRLQPWDALISVIYDVSLPSGLTSIGACAFYNCYRLTSVSIPSGVTSIGPGAFYGCSRLYSVSIPSGVTTIGNNAFESCISLSSVTLPTGVTSIGRSAFQSCAKLTRINIPNTVIEIGSRAFSLCGLTSIVLPNGLRAIEENTFSNCSSLSSITIPDSVTNIGSFAFVDCEKLLSVAIPSGVTSIGQNAFSGCRGLTSFTLPDSLTSIAFGLFTNCTGLTSIFIPDAVTSIGGDAFENCSGLSSVQIGAGLTSIGFMAFDGCTGITSFSVDPNNTAYCSNDGVLYTKTMSRLVLYPTASMRTSYTIPDGVTSIDGFAFQNCNWLSTIMIPGSMTNIGYKAFDGCKWLKTVVFFASKEQRQTGLKIGSDNTALEKALWRYAIKAGKCGNALNWALDLETGCFTITGSGAMDNYVSSSDQPWEYYRSYIQKVVIESGATSIGDHAFSGCDGHYESSEFEESGIQYPGLTSIAIPDSVTSIGMYAFSGCSNLDAVTIPNGVTSIGRYAFSGCSNLDAVTIPNSVTSIDEYAFSGCSNLDAVTLSNHTTFIGNNAFSECTALKSIIVPQSVLTIGDNVFSNCSSLFFAYIGNGVTTVGTNVFSGCSSLQALNVPFIGSKPDATGEEAILGYFFGKQSFSGGINLTHYERWDEKKMKWIEIQYCFPAGLSFVNIMKATSIPTKAFYGCSMLTSIAIPSSVTNIGSDAFFNCTGLSEVHISDIAGWCSVTFNGAYSSPFAYADNLYVDGELVTNLTIPDGVTEIGQESFSGCAGLTSVTIPDSVTNINKSAFSDCSGLVMVTMGNGVSSIGDYAFDNCSKLRTVYYHGTSLMRSKMSISARNNSYLTNATWRYIMPFSGTCGKSVKWTYEDGGILTISGSGAMSNYSSSDEQPWARWREQIATLVIEDGVTSIGDYAFYDCSRITKTTIPNSIKTIGSNAFLNCSGLKSFVVPGSVTAVGDFAFYDCSNLASLTLTEGVETIGQFAFCNNTGLTVVAIPTSLQIIGDGAFNYCTGLKTVNYMGKEEQRAQLIIRSSNEYLLNASWQYLTLASIEMKALPDTLVYSEGEANVPKVTGGVVLARYLDGGEAELPLTADMVSGLDTSMPGKQTLTVTCEGKIATFEITIEHVPGEAVKENEVPATCTAEGSYDEVVYCSACETELSREKKVIDKLPHTPGEAVKENEVPATCAAEGGYDEVVYCTVCHEELDREHTVIEKTGDHTPGEPVIENEVPANCTYDGSYDEVVYCTVCGEVLSRENRIIEKSGEHVPGAPVKENEVKATTTTRGHYDEVVYCTVCGEELSREEKAINKSVKGLTIVGEPEDAKVKNGEKATFTVKISGKATAIQWYYRTSETAKWKKVSSKGNKLTLTVAAKPSNDGYQYRCELKNGKKKLYSDTVTLDVELFPPTISSQPESVAIKAGEEATFTFGVEGEGVTYAWSYRKSATGKWAKVKGGTGATLTVTGTAANAGYQYKCEAKNKDGKVISDIVTLDVEYHLPEITTQPKGAKVKKNAKVTFNVEADNPYDEELTFQWYYRKTSKAKWTKIKGATEATYSFKASAKKSGYQYKCDITNHDGTVSTKAVTLKVK